MSDCLRTSTLAALLAATAACTFAATSRSDDVGSSMLTDDERAAIAEEVRARVEAFADAERRIDTDAIVGFIAPDFYMYGDGSRVGREATVAQMRATLPTLQRFETTWSDVEINVLSRDAAFSTMRFRDEITGADGATTRMRGPSTMVWRLVDGEWLISFVDADHYPIR